MNSSTKGNTSLVQDLDAIAKQEVEANGILMKGLQKFGSVVQPMAETALNVAPDIVTAAIIKALETAYDMSAVTDRVEMVKNASTIWGRAGAVATGAIGGFMGAASTLGEIPVTTMIMLDTIKKVARKYGFDTDDEMVKRECLAVFASGSDYTSKDDQIVPAFVTTRILVNGSAVSALIAKVSADFSARLMSKLGVQAIPVLGAFTGGAVNYAFSQWFEDMAEVHFKLLKLSNEHGQEQVNALYTDALEAARSGRSKSLPKRLR